jgi:hypothetical protein
MVRFPLLGRSQPSFRITTDSRIEWSCLMSAAGNFEDVFKDVRRRDPLLPTIVMDNLHLIYSPEAALKIAMLGDVRLRASCSLQASSHSFSSSTRLSPWLW